jgi:hypothetical protein
MTNKKSDETAGVLRRDALPPASGEVYRDGGESASRQAPRDAFESGRMAKKLSAGRDLPLEHLDEPSLPRLPTGDDEDDIEDVDDQTKTRLRPGPRVPIRVEESIATLPPPALLEAPLAAAGERGKTRKFRVTLLMLALALVVLIAAAIVWSAPWYSGQ